jgi:hypothetical protein
MAIARLLALRSYAVYPAVRNVGWARKPGVDARNIGTLRLPYMLASRYSR